MTEEEIRAHVKSMSAAQVDDMLETAAKMAISSKDFRRPFIGALIKTALEYPERIEQMVDLMDALVDDVVAHEKLKGRMN